MLRTRRNYGSITNQGVRAMALRHVLARYRAVVALLLAVPLALAGSCVAGVRRHAAAERPGYRLRRPAAHRADRRSGLDPGHRRQHGLRRWLVQHRPAGRRRAGDQHRSAVQFPGLRPDHRQPAAVRARFNAQVRALAVSPDQKILYVGGQFTQVNGANRYRLVAFDLTKSPAAVLTSFTATMDASVYGLAATETQAVRGRPLLQGQQRARTGAAAVDARTGAVQPFTGDSGRRCRSARWRCRRTGPRSCSAAASRH